MDFFTAAQMYLPQQPNQQDPERQRIIRELETILNNSPILTPGEKQKMAQVIPAFNNATIQELQQSLIRQNLRYLQAKSHK